MRFLLAAIAVTAGLFLFENTLFWEAIRVTGSTGFVSLVLASILAPLPLLIMKVGSWTDRVGPRPLLLTSLLAWIATMVGAALFTGRDGASGPLLLALGICDGVCTAVWIVPSQVMLGRVVPAGLMATAIGLGGLQFAAGRIIGGLAAANLIQVVGTRPTFAVAATLVGVGGLAMLGVKGHPAAWRAPAAQLPAKARDAFNWLRRDAEAVVLILMGPAIGVFAFTYLAVLPGVSRYVLHAGSEGLGLMTAAGGAGIGLTALLADSLGRRYGRGRLLFVAVGTGASALVLLGLSSNLAASVLLAGVLSGSLTLYTSVNNMLLQALAPPEMRGRVLAMYGLGFWAVLPFGSLLIGWSVDHAGARSVLEAMGVLTLSTVGCVLLTDTRLWRLDIGPDGAVTSRRPGA